MNSTIAHRHVLIGQRIRTIREQKKLRQVDLAHAAQMSWRHLIRMERGVGGEPKRETLDRLADALGVQRSELTGDPDDEDPSSMPLTGEEFAMLGDLMRRLGSTLAEARSSNPARIFTTVDAPALARTGRDGGEPQ